MSDQEIKPTEGANGVAETVSITPGVKEEEMANANADATGHEPGESSIQDAVDNAAQSASKTEETEVIDANDVKKTAKDDSEDNAGAKLDIIKPPEGMLRVNRRGTEPRQKSDASVLAESSDPDEIRAQVEFYFSDSNLPNDKFLWEKTQGTENKAVPLSLVCSFSRMRRFKPYSAVVEALKASKNLVVEGTEDKETIRRKIPCKPADNRDRERDERSTYIKGFGEEEASTQFDIERFLAQYGQYNSVRLRRDEKSRNFKGSVFVEWADKEIADKFIALDPQPRWKDHPLFILTKIQYMAIKSQDIRDGKIPMKGTNNFNGRPQRGRGFGRGNHGSRRGSDANDWKKRREEDQRNGFSDRRGRRDNRGRGRTRGRGGKPRHQTAGNRMEEQSAPRDDGKPRINMSKEGEKAVKEANGKRSREEDAGADTPPTKKVDAKETGGSAT